MVLLKYHKSIINDSLYDEVLKDRRIKNEKMFNKLALKNNEEEKEEENM